MWNATRGGVRRVGPVWAAVLVAAVAGGVLAGCGGGGEPMPTRTAVEQDAPSPAVSPPPTATPTPTPTPAPIDEATVEPERPAAMDTVDSNGAAAVAAYYTELFSYVFAASDLTQYRPLTHPECVYCADVIGHAEEQQAAGVHMIGGLVEVESSTAAEIDPGKWWTVDVEAIQNASVDVNAEGTVVAEVPRKTFHFDIAVIRVDDQWMVRAIGYERTDQ